MLAIVFFVVGVLSNSKRPGSSERKKQSARTPLPAATGPTNTHESDLCGYGYGPRVGTAAVDALGVRRARLVTSAGRAEGQTEGRRSRHIVRMRSKGAEFEARGHELRFGRGTGPQPRRGRTAR